MLFQTSPWIGMPAQPARYTPAAATDTVVHDLPPIRFDGQPVDIRLSLRRTEDGVWRGRIMFGAGAEDLGARAMAKLRHDLSNPLSAILAEAQLLLLAPEKYEEETLAGLKQIEDLARKMRQMLQSVE